MKEPNWYDQDYYVTGNKMSGYGPKQPYTWAFRKEHSYANARDLICNCLPFRKTLEVGCATGLTVRALRELGFESYGYDASTWAIQNADPIAKPFLAAGMAQELKVPDSSHDLVYSIDVLEHLVREDAIKALREMIRVARHDVFFRVGFLTEQEWASNPNPAGWAANTGDASHCFYITARMWEDLIVEAGGIHLTTTKSCDLGMGCRVACFIVRKQGAEQKNRGTFGFSPRFR
jgi:SAM-dependent methyltransferase